MSLSSDQRKQADAHITDLRARAVANAVAKAGPSSLTTNRLAQQAADTFDKVSLSLIFESISLDNLLIFSSVILLNCSLIR